MSALLTLLIGPGAYLLYQVFLSLSTGWYRLAKLYTTPVRMGSKIGSGPLGMSDDGSDAHLRFWATLTPAPEGLYLSMPWFLSLLCPPLLIPWKDFVLAPKVDLTGRSRVKLFLRNGDTMALMQKEYLAMEPYLRHLPHRPVPPKAAVASARLA